MKAILENDTQQW